ncbi:fumarylacetoacetate hydrolase family protein [Ornithinimicrobium sp. F0845]|uniref:fumarylacetoacetate hydrolase family protein n=1 Tax=Ornithinimicrobium sp. F0845 TaxID=2926412 RepID=UPI001FF242F5|nr:fumarylacetoacetate hydrolase family protein [Ornithinimicrobium sp. F0845]MCK0114230.1 fumarylacetoacetate hydrolase family protein [Ornithinimicrobium sp. F0845]
MPLIGYVQDGVRHIGELEDDTVYPVATVADFYKNPTTRVTRAGEGIPRDQITEAPFIPETARVFCVGINYHSHAEESKRGAGQDLPKFPMVFGRWPSTLVTNGTKVPVPPNEGLDWEAELAVVIKDKVWLADRASARDHVLGYAAFNDLSARAKQLATTQFALGKNADRSGPIGPALFLPQEIEDVDNLEIQSRVNGETMQSANTRDLIFSIEDIIAYITDTITLLPGDVIATGTPGGVGLGQTPPRYLNPGDVVEVELSTIGVLRNPIVDRADIASEL